MMKKSVLPALIAATLISAPALAHQAGDIIVRAGAVVVAPDESSQDVDLTGLGLPNLGEFSVDDNTQLGLNFGYMITDNIGIELLAATPFKHTVSLAGIDIAETKHLPPTLVAQYYFGDAQSKLRPYVGLGVNFTNFFDNEFTSDANAKVEKAIGTNLELDNLSLSNSWGWAAQVGLDYQVNKNWLVNGSIWYADISTDVKFDSVAGPLEYKADIDPWVYMISVGYVF
ncbi:MAG: outer membrane protein OmpW [Shewanella sp.]|nr:outer membrane protein OmpW [Shewanella sp.]